MDHTRREERLENNWRVFRITSMSAAAVLIVILLVVDAYYSFSSMQLNVTIGLLALAFFALFKLEYWLHQMARIVRRRREESLRH